MAANDITRFHPGFACDGNQQGGGVILRLFIWQEMRYIRIMKKLFFTLLLFFPFTAQAQTAQGTVEEMHNCLKREASACGSYFTESSQELYQKALARNGARCLPEEITYASEKEFFIAGMPKGSHRLVRIRFVAGEEVHYSNLVVTREQQSWKLNLPQSLRRSLGENWQRYVNASEAALLLAETQLKQPVPCEMIRSLAIFPREQALKKIQ